MPSKSRPRTSVPDYRPQLASLVEAPPKGEEWVHEQKFDGYRMGLRIDGKVVELWSRREQEWTAQFPTVVAAGAALGVAQALIDGEVAAVLPNGITSFQALQNRTAGTTLAFFAFDLLFLDGEDLRERPLLERKERLRELFARQKKEDGVLRFSEHVVGGGDEFLAAACKHGLEGVVSKRAEARYRAGRNTDWQKSKCLQRQEFLIGGFTDPERSRQGLGALLIGYHEEGQLRWAGKVGTGTGWNATFLKDLRRRLDALKVPQSPFEPPVADASLRRTAHWVRPTMVAEVAFGEWTNDGRIRHGSVQGIREDKSPEEVVRERPRRTRAARKD